jgi:hypothetical protein
MRWRRRRVLHFRPDVSERYVLLNAVRRDLLRRGCGLRGRRAGQQEVRPRVHRQRAVPSGRAVLRPGGGRPLRESRQHLGVHATDDVRGRGLPVYDGGQLRADSVAARVCAASEE